MGVHPAGSLAGLLR